MFAIYDIEKLAARAAEWRAEADAATIPAMRQFCLQEAKRCEHLIQRSLEVRAVRDMEATTAEALAPIAVLPSEGSQN